jgi:hypothetical protein
MGNIWSCIRRFSSTAAALLCVLVSGMAFSLTQREIGTILLNGTVKVNIYEGENLVGLGSGIMLSRDGYIGTNFHVISQAVDRNYRVVVEAENSSFKGEAEVRNWDQGQDFAVIKIKDTGGRIFHPIVPGDSDSMRPLDTIFVAGFPVTGVYKVQRGDLNSIQTFGGIRAFDISVLIDHGNSGGPVVDENGTLVGVSFSYHTKARSMNLAIRINDIKQIINDAVGGKFKSLVRDGNEVEGNNTQEISNLIVNGLEIKGKIDSGRDVDWFEVNRQEGTRPTFTITHDREHDFDFEVYSTKFLSARARGSESSVTCNVPGRCFVKVWSKKGSGHYRMKITPASRYDGGAELENNDVREMANPVGARTITGTLRGDDTTDWFVLGGQEGQRPTFTITHDAGSNFDFEVYSDETRVGSATGTGSPDVITCSVPGRCHVKVWRVSGEGAYSLDVNPRGGTDMEREPNNDRSSATLARGIVLKGTLDGNDTEDWFELGGQEGRNPTFTITHGTGCNFDFEVFSGNDLAGRAIGTGASDSLRCFVPGRCYVRIWRVSGSGDYTLSISAPDTRQPNIGGQEREPNNTRDKATLTRSMNLSGSLDGSDTEDWFELGGQEGTMPSFTIRHSNDCNFDFEVYSGNVVAGRGDATGPAETIRCMVPGRCFLKIWRVSGSGPYTMTVTRSR